MRKKFLIIISLAFFSLLMAESKLPIIATKQSVQSIRLITQDGRFTYYQSAQGKLLLSRDFDVVLVLEGAMYTNYLVQISPARKRLLISQDNAFHSFLGTRKLLEIFAADLGSPQSELLGMGISPALHLDDRWASYYNPHTTTIYFKNLENKQTSFAIELFNKSNLFFIPQVVMLNDEEIIYTDINQAGIAGIIYFKRSEKKPIVKVKATNIMQRFELCRSSSSLFVGRFNHGKSNTTSTIQQAALKDGPEVLDRLQQIYESKDDDFGNINCTATEKKLYFIKAIGQGGKRLSEAASLELKTGVVTVESDLEFVTNLIEMDGKLLIAHNGITYLLYGENNLGRDDLGHPVERSGKEEKK
ncbi:MAG: hypothetical protein A2504_06625 [Bdellovibrionales bacterium RIFOXYD12_FULL_39_22]|nr:MAG: hypothetical protein A2385_08945 [Bdellovibrionales bacterium RIFOXYB1_FULL_39_21]OFZ45173.1 MAG: hypothetical protein A2485_05590 [Bdellovibrionales bacterium RIFOXYC12_FULL_39_17]OFZ45635.1 MAG: hypothetical protein A2404_03525 [Bdellovibrionales bacterium RIFOXYC1_FULL_39_130]OFZ74175.1 MAG: hypothetical protein A2451_05895 [Bdellovibrionales bacterium RIFOXYC2_FULL_39_8]OFZ77497.1 MAG: hypothetical protein A2560_09115 [Bdellovibrionales bacterium RIFOXYD1_FULL_39_84]OFZ91626.1 MAG: